MKIAFMFPMADSTLSTLKNLLTKLRSVQAMICSYWVQLSQREWSRQVTRMKQLGNYHQLVISFVVGSFAGLWYVGTVSDTALIAVLSMGLSGSLLSGQQLYGRLQRCTHEREHLQREAVQLNTHMSILMKQAYYDNLTGLGNRNLLADRFNFAVERCMRNQATFALLMIDLNHFKFINDNYGHSAGDEVLITSSKRLVAAVRASDTVVRMGGDEFLLLIERGGNANDVFQLGQKLIDSLSEEIALSSGDIVSVGASVGVAQFPKDGFEFGKLIEFADQSMYECKTSGRMPLEIA